MPRRVSSSPGCSPEQRPAFRSTSRSARHSFSGVNGGSGAGPPAAAATAFAIAAGVPIAPPSPIPLEPRGLFGEGDSTNAVAIGGISVGPGRLYSANDAPRS